MGWLRSRRLHYFLGGVAIIFMLLLLLRAVFLFGFSAVTPGVEQSWSLVLETLGIGVRFDLRLAILLMLPVMLLAWLPVWNSLRSSLLRWIGRIYLIVALAVVLLLYIIDFGHYAYLGVRLNASALKFLADAQISQQMLWETYPVVWITLAWLALLLICAGALIGLERLTFNRPAIRIGLWSRIWGSSLMVVLVFLAILGRYTNINLENPVPLRWSDAFFSGDSQLGALGLNPVIFFYDTMGVPQERYDLDQVRRHYPQVSQYLGVAEPDIETLPLARQVPLQPHRLTAEQRPNVVFVMLESLGTTAVGAYGNPLQPTPNLDRLAKQSWFFRHFYVPVTGTAKTVWASITGIPDVSRQETATRNPLITNQHTLINALEGYHKVYTIGGNSGWANMNALIRQSIDGVKLYEEGGWKAKNVDVWGISDLDLFKETDQILRDLPRDKPFFAYIQTAGHHRPYTIPKENDGFQVIDRTLEEVQAAGSQSVAQYNAVRLLDFNIGRLMELAEEGGYLNNTIFVMFGDHNTRIANIDYMKPAFEKLGLESNNVPLLIYAPGLLQPREFEEAVGLADLLPTITSLLGYEYENRTMGRDLLQPAPEGERVVPLVLREGTFPLIGAVTQDFLLQMNYDGTEPSLHDLDSDTPLDNVAEAHPEEYRRLLPLARGLYETSRYMLYENVRD
ncbi:sulfatase-like hydrolase/transferase [Halopseudomonas nanhaiensis]|uniref:LTA synthase family protein n=1 Tax=Halopseudomonas nanhaiensis TaxID=2830842 RepID=UPI001CBAFB5F|nr:alkaline phosphatase family protein [Halopseudomonas nanhaiensis]UAW97634.1 sulfatase-like hydrolase/transferase [Halopseudomonas nanhaiensis]